jgi:putative tricarboxylic transport membrane protein
MQPQFFESLLLVLGPSVYPYLFLGVVLGIVVGALPGLTATMAMIVLLPLTFGMPPITSIQLLMGVFVGGITAGSVTAIAVSIPGTAASAPTALEGAAFRRQGRAGEAISLMYITSMIGGILGAIAFITVAPLLARFALSFGPPEYFLLMLISMSLVISLSSASLLKGLIAALLGMASSLVGVDPMTATPRMTFGISELEAGLGYGAVIIGLFGLTEVLTVLAQPQDATGPLQAERSAYRSDLSQAIRRLPSLGWTTLRSTVVGVVVGALPGIGSDVAAWLGYDLEKRFSKHPEEFGNGSIQGMTGCEVANNSEAGGALIPAMTFGIPGDAQMVVILGALLMNGVRPGPLLFQQESLLVWSVFSGLIVAQVTTLVLGLLSVRPILWLIRQPTQLLYPAICLFCLIGAFSYANSFVDMGIVIAFGLLGFLMRWLGFALVPMVLAFILTPMMEAELRRGLVLAHNDPTEFLQRPVFLVLLAIGVAAFATAVRFVDPSARLRVQQSD